mmetsp:Transcript_17531/g.35381  ORF Transcript_17531/g.35381 Transcript_17531/m.35381 type:complete len:82 (+) Transcript_17531:98-343(+)
MQQKIDTNTLTRRNDSMNMNATMHKLNRCNDGNTTNTPVHQTHRKHNTTKVKNNTYIPQTQLERRPHHSIHALPHHRSSQR